MRCDQCRYWNRKEMRGTGVTDPDVDDENAARPTVAECTKAQPYWETTEWKQDEESKEFSGSYVRVTKPEFDGLKLFVQDGSDYKALMLTTADFFCAHYEALSTSS